MPSKNNLVQQLIWPFWSSWYNLRAYLDSVTLIREELSVKPNQKMKIVLSQIEIILLLVTVRFITLLYISFAKLPTFWKQLLHDYMLYLDSPPLINLLPALFALQTIVFNLKMTAFNYDRHFKPLLIVRQILFYPFYNFFLENEAVQLRNQKIVSVNDQILQLTSLYINFTAYFYLTSSAFCFSSSTTTYCCTLSTTGTTFCTASPCGTASLLCALSNSLISKTTCWFASPWSTHHPLHCHLHLHTGSLHSTEAGK